MTMGDSVLGAGIGAIRNADEIGEEAIDGAVAEPLVEDLEQVQPDEQHAPAQHIAQPPRVKTSKYQPLASHPVQSYVEEGLASPPPDFTRRGIHIPTRTR